MNKLTLLALLGSAHAERGNYADGEPDQIVCDTGDVATLCIDDGAEHCAYLDYGDLTITDHEDKVTALLSNWSVGQGDFDTAKGDGNDPVKVKAAFDLVTAASRSTYAFCAPYAECGTDGVDFFRTGDVAANAQGANWNFPGVKVSCEHPAGWQAPPPPAAEDEDTDEDTEDEDTEEKETDEETEDEEPVIAPYEYTLDFDKIQPPVGRSCRCAGGNWAYVLDDDDNRVEKMGKDEEPLVDADGNAVFEVEWVNCPDEPTHYITNWLQLEVDEDGNTIWLKECPANWEVPEDAPPADQGSFKGYTNKYSMSNVDDEVSSDDGTKVTFYNESADMNGWDDVAKAGCIVGFVAFGLGIIIVVIMIAIDMKKRMQMYEGLIDEDVDKMKKMGLESKFREFEVELAARMAGGDADEGVDDQLVTQALELKPSEFSQYM